MATEVMSLGSLSRFYKALHSREQKAVAGEMLLAAPVFANWLHVTSVARNVVAHHSRLWNKELGVSAVRPRSAGWSEREAPYAPNRCFFLLLLLRKLLESSHSGGLGLGFGRDRTTGGCYLIQPKPIPPARHLKARRTSHKNGSRRLSLFTWGVQDPLRRGLWCELSQKLAWAKPGHSGTEATVEWIDVKALEAWADRVDARAHLMKMLVDLINATVSESHRLRFPHGEKGQVRGWDGDLDVPVGQGRVPEGCSKWEFGTGAAETKANADYQKRTAQTSAEVMSKNTLVIVNLTTWDTPRKKIADWQDDRNREGKWKEVRCIDGTELAHWLGEHPAIAARYARDYLGRAPKEGALSTDEYWEEFSTQFEPELSEKLVIAGRKAEADEIIAHLSGTAKSTLLGAETSEEVIAFSVAAIRSAPDDVRRDLESRTLILRSESTARFFSKHSNMCFLVTGDAEPMAGKLGNNCPTISAVTGVANRRHNALSRPTASAMAEGFASMGMEHGEGYELAHRCGRSLTILKRLKHKVRPKDPEWLPMVAALVPAFLAGGWSSDLEKDREVVAELAEVPRYGDIERELVKTLVMSDRPIDREEEVWQVRAAVDAFFFTKKC